jgi:uncharacterized integral membrane protein
VRILKLIVLLAILALLVVFAVQNTKPATVRFLGWSAEMSLAFPLLAAYVLGGLTGRLLVRLFRSWRRDASAERRRRRTSASEHAVTPRDDHASPGDAPRHDRQAAPDPRADTVVAPRDHGAPRAG